MEMQVFSCLICAYSSSNRYIYIVWLKLLMLGKTNMPKLRLFTINGRFISVKDPLKADITDLLKDREKSFKDIVAATSKPKSSVFVKLDEMRKEGLIRSFSDPDDRRSRLYRLDAKLVGTNHKAMPDLFEKSMERLDKVIDDPFSFMNYLFRSLWHLLDSFGVDAQPMLNILGENVGKQLLKRIKSSDARGILEELAGFFSKNKLSYIKIIEDSPLTFMMYDCYQCGEVKGRGICLCSFYLGIFKEVFPARLGKNVIIKQLECHSKGADACKLVIIE